MANVLALIELEGGAASPASLSALNQGRRIATSHGATLYAVVACAKPPGYDDDDIVAVLSRHGADKVVLVTNEQLSGPLLYATHHAALGAVCNQLPPQLVLAPGTPGGRDIAARLALDLDGYYLPEARLDLDGARESTIEHYSYGRSLFASTRLMELPRPLVVALASSLSEPAAWGVDEAEVVVIQAPTQKDPKLKVLSSGETPSTATLVLVSGERVAGEARQQLEALSVALGAHLVQCTNSESITESVAGFDVVLAFHVEDELDPWDLPPTTALITVDGGSSPLRKAADFAMDATDATATELLDLITAMDGS